MPQTPTQICNSALTKIGGRRITAYTGVYSASASKEQQLVDERLSPCINQMARSHVWRFLKTYEETTGTAGTLDAWAWIHTLPTDMLRMLSFTDNDTIVAFERFGNTIHCNSETAVVRYVRQPILLSVDNTPPTEDIVADSFPDDFAEALACYLASDICVSLTQNDDMRQGMLSQYEGLLRMARFNGAVEREDMKIQSNDWMAARDNADMAWDPPYRT